MMNSTSAGLPLTASITATGGPADLAKISSATTAAAKYIVFISQAPSAPTSTDIIMSSWACISVGSGNLCARIAPTWCI
jgi:hypothetical protein